jgi:hypothetical protein
MAYEALTPALKAETVVVPVVPVVPLMVPVNCHRTGPRKPSVQQLVATLSTAVVLPVPVQEQAQDPPLASPHTRARARTAERAELGVRS